MRIKRLVATLTALPLALSLQAMPAHASSGADPFARKLEKLYSNIEKEYRPDVRWWLAEGLNTDDTLRKNIQAVSDAGFGAAEFLAMPEAGAEDSIYGWGSQEWNSDSRLIMEEATRLGLGFSLTSGAHWSHANLPDTYTWSGEPYNPDSRAASKTLDYATLLLEPGEVFDGTLPLPPAVAGVSHYDFQGVAAARIVTPRANAGQAHSYAQGTGIGVLDFDSATDLTSLAMPSGSEYSLNWTAPGDGRYAVFVYWMRGTAQTGSPSVSTNYTINYVDSYGTDALVEYWGDNILTPEVAAMVRENGHGEIYMDSLELEAPGAAGTLWGYGFKQEFQERRGYDITKYLPFLSRDYVFSSSTSRDYLADGGKETEVEKIRNDFHKTLTDLYGENVLAPLQSWLHTMGMTLRAEPSYGYTYEISTPGKYIDGIEVESLEHAADLDVFRGVLGSANMYGRTFSSETGAALGRNYWYDMDYFTQLSYLQFVGGVSRTVFHGYSAIEGSDADTKWPGHEGMQAMFSERFSTRQPAWAQYPAWTEMLGRNQKVLRQGQPQRDIAILRTDTNYIAFSFPAGRSTPEQSNSMHDSGFYWKDMSLQHAGYTYDYFSPQLLEDTANVKWSDGLLQPNGPAYQAVIVYQGSMELSSARKLLELARSGVPVVFVNNVTETLNTGLRTPLYDVTYPKAAETSKFYGDSDTELAAVVHQIKALSNVKEIDNQADTLRTLKGLGVEPRVSYAEPTSKLMTISRLDKASGILYTFAYSYKFEVAKGDPAETYQLSLAGEGKPYTIDDWTGQVSEIGTYSAANGRTNVQVTLKPGEAEIIAVNLKDSGGSLHAQSTTADEVLLTNGTLSVKTASSGTYATVLSDGRTVTSEMTVPAEIPLSKWNIAIQDWNAGDKVTNTENRFGHTTTEAYFKTKKTTLRFADSGLVPWKDLPASSAQLAQLDNTASMAQVSGIGTYTTSFKLPTGWTDTNGAMLRIESTGGGLATIFVNGKAAPGLDLRSGEVDITDLLVQGTNTVKVVASSTLTNRLKQRGYGGWLLGQPPVRAYGLQGEVTVAPYSLAELPAAPVPPTPADKTALAAAVKAAEQLKADAYTAASYKALSDAVAAAKELLANADATQEQVDAGVSAVTNALAGLVVAKPGQPPAPSIKATKVKLSQNAVTIVKGKTFTPSVGVYYDGTHPSYAAAVTWKSSNTKVAKVRSDGRITALKPGKVTITATAKKPAADGKYLTAKLTVTVVKSKPKAKVTKVSAAVPKTMKVGQVAYTVGKYKSAKAAGVKVSYSTSKYSIVEVDKAGRLVAVKKGTDTVVVKAGGKTAKYKVTVK